MGDSLDFLRQEYTIDTPENVTFAYEVAGIGHRFIGALVDSTILVVTLVLSTVAMFTLLGIVDGTEPAVGGDGDQIGWVGGLILALYALVTFAVIWGYYILFELTWHGRTPGKRLAGIRVVRMDGNPAGGAEVVVRNLVRFIDFLPVAYGVGLIVMLCNAQARRLGDYAAGTLVIKEPATAAPEAMDAALRHAAAPAGSAARQSLVELAVGRQLTDDDRALIHEVLQRHAAGTAPDSVVLRLAALMAAKLEAAPPRPNRTDGRQFLLLLINAAPPGRSDPTQTP